MCLAIPVVVASRDGDRGVVTIGGLERAVDLRLVPDAGPGDFVLLHAGFAIQTVDPAEARETFELLAAMELSEPPLAPADDDAAAGRPG